MKKNLIVLTVLALVFNLSAQAQESVSKFKGIWEYTCNDAPFGYETGDIIIKKKDNKYSSTTIYNDGSQNVSDSVKVKDGALIIEMYVEGSYVKVALKKKELKLVGSVYTNDGELEIVAKKKK